MDVQAIPGCLGRLRIRLHSYGIQMKYSFEGLCRRIRQGDKHVRSLSSSRMGFESVAHVTPGATLALRQMQGEVITGEWILVLVDLHIERISASVSSSKNIGIGTSSTSASNLVLHPSRSLMKFVSRQTPRPAHQATLPIQWRGLARHRPLQSFCTPLAKQSQVFWAWRRERHQRFHNCTKIVAHRYQDFDHPHSGLHMRDYRT